MNIKYLSDEIGAFYSQNRIAWDQFYPSEKYIFEKVFSTTHDDIKTVLDVGCACGGLGLALNERFQIKDYTGIDINASAIEQALLMKNEFPFDSSFLCADILNSDEFLNERKFDLVTSLSCADWNCETIKILEKCWYHTANNGYFIFSFRITNEKSIRGLEDGFQFVHFDDVTTLKGTEEKAPYVVTNIHEVFQIVNSFIPLPSNLMAYGYWGKPSSLAVIPYKRIVHSVFAIQKTEQEVSTTLANLILPLDIFNK